MRMDFLDCTVHVGTGWRSYCLFVVGKGFRRDIYMFFLLRTMYMPDQASTPY